MNDLYGKRVGCAMTGSFCTFKAVFDAWRALKCTGAELTPILSFNAARTDTRFCTSREVAETLAEIAGVRPLTTLAQVEPIGPKKLFDALVIAPCTGNTLAKLAHSIADGPVTMATKSHLRNGRPILIAVSTNDGMAGAAENIGKLLARKHYYFVPFHQDDPVNKPTSLVADFTALPQALEEAMAGRQIQPVLI